MDAQTGTAQWCQCCRNAPATLKWHVKNAMEYYVYTCQLCGEMLRTFRNSEKAECYPYAGVLPEDNDPLEEVRDEFDKALNLLGLSPIGEK